MDDQVVRMREALQQVMDQLIAADAELDKEIAAQQAESERAEARRAERAREGELGDDWRRMQQRIDADETTLADVFGGADDSPLAQALRERSSQNLRELAREWQKQDESGIEEPSPAAVVSQAEADSLAHYAATLQQIDEAIAAIDRMGRGRPS